MRSFGTEEERDAAHAFFARHDAQYALAHAAFVSAAADVACPSKQERLLRRTQALVWNRYVRPEHLAQVVVYSAGGRRKRDEPAKKEWKLEESAWKARAAWADSGSFLDTEETYRKAFALDWSRALRSHGLAAYILKHGSGESKDEEKAERRSEMEAGEGAADDEAGNGARDDALLDELLAERRRVKAEEAAARKISQSSEIAEIGEVLWKHHATIYRTFDAYSIISATTISHMSAIAFKRFVEDCELSDSKSKFCQKAHLDQVFLMVNTPETAKRVGKAQVDLALVGGELGSLNTGAAVDDDKLALNRCEWLQCLVRIAILKYVLSKQISEVSRAVEHMFTSKVEALLGSSSSFDANDFRLANCYSEATDAVLLEHFESLKALFETYSLAEGVDFANRQLATVLFVRRVDAADERPRFH